MTACSTTSPRSSTRSESVLSDTASAGPACTALRSTTAAATIGSRRRRSSLRPRIDFEGGEFRFSGLPLLIVHGSADQVIALDQSESVHDEAEDALLVLLIDADHFQPVYGAERPEALALSGGLLTTFLDVHVAGVAEIDELDNLIAEYGERVIVR